MKWLLDAFVDHNLGDDLMLDLLVRRYPGTFFCPLRDRRLNDLVPYADWPNFMVVDWVDLDRVLPHMDGFLIYGGSMWQDHGDNLHWYHWRQCVMDTFRPLGRPVVALGNSIGPLATPAGERLFADLIRGLAHFTVRDATSYRWVQDHVPGNACSLTGDLVFSHPMARPGGEEGLVGLSIHRSMLSEARNEAFADAIVELVRSTHALRPELRFRLFGFDTITERDDLLMDQIYHRLGRPAHVTLRSYLGDLPDFLADFGRCSHVFAARFHALVLALLWGIPFTPFDYMGKSAALLRDLDYGGPLFTHDDFRSRLGEARDSLLQGGCRHDPAALAAMIDQSKENFTFLDRMLAPGALVDPKRMLLAMLARS